MSATRRARPRAPSEDPTDLPPYEPLELTLSDNVARSLNALAAGRDSRRYEEHIRKATTLLGRNVAAANDRLAERQGDLQTILAKRAARGAEKTPADLRLEAWIAEFQAEVAALTAESEAAVRDLVDRKAAAQDDKDAIAATADHIQSFPTRAQRLRDRRAAAAADTSAQDAHPDDDGAEPDLPPPEDPIHDILQGVRADKAQAYAALPPYERYALNNDYAAFKKLWHDATLGDQDVPLPDPARWFDRDGNPVASARGGARRGAGGDGHDGDGADEDDDLVIEGEIQSFICPLSLQPLTQPFSNNKCSHTFQKESIQAWFAEMRNQERTCPTTGCNVQLKLGDFYDDDLILRKILRQKRRLAAEAAAAEEIDDVSDEDEAPRRRSQAVKKERRGSDDEIEDDS
ncbi:hypothetical protein VDGD_05571 [Verticillium dahliae]|nr:hypothetical protein VDGD_05571 [Verticillium dahliae]